jgi:SAM-dependent methyltransferase
MKEQLIMPELEKRIKVLELGNGGWPASKMGGSIFDDHNADYVGIDLPKEARSYWDKSSLTGANSAHMPFRDDSFDYIVMRSIFGQFTGRETPSDIEDVRMWGMYEAFRVLKPGGIIAVSEENTPWYIQYVESYLKEAGFKVTDYAQLTQEYDDTPDDNKYRKLRSQFYNNRPTMAGPTSWGYPFIIVAEKPEKPEYVEVAAEVRRFSGWKNEVHTVRSDLELWKKDTELLTTVVYKKGKENTDPNLVPPRFV